MTTQQNGQRQVYFEMRRVGAYMRCTAIDGLTGIEVTVAGPANRNPEELQRVAVQKLEYVLKRG